MASVQTTENTILLLWHVCVLWALPSNIHWLWSHCLSMGLYATVLCFPYFPESHSNAWQYSYQKHTGLLYMPSCSALLYDVTTTDSTLTQDFCSDITEVHISCSSILKILWHINLLLANDHKTNETTAIARQQPACNSGSAVGRGVFCVVRSEALSLDWPSWFQLVQWSGASWLVSDWVRGLLPFSPCEPLLLDEAWEL
jgi:hypothetical protein